MRKISQVNEAPDPRLSSGPEVGREERPNSEDNTDNLRRQSAAEMGAEGSVDKDVQVKVHTFRYIGKDGDGLVFRKDRDEEKMNSENWQYLGEFSLPGGFVNQLPRNEDDTEWRVVHKNTQ